MPRNLANWPKEFGEICRGKLWSLEMLHDGGVHCALHVARWIADKKFVSTEGGTAGCTLPPEHEIRHCQMSAS